MNQNKTTTALDGASAIASVVTVQGSYFLPLVEGMIDATAWCVRKTGALFRR